jgi:hypothetical protein
VKKIPRAITFLSLYFFMKMILISGSVILPCEIMMGVETHIPKNMITPPPLKGADCVADKWKEIVELFAPRSLKEMP